MFKTKSPKSLKSTLLRAFIVPVMSVAGLAFGCLFLSTPAMPAIAPSVPLEQADSYPETLTADFAECWGNDGEQHPYPTNVIFNKGGDWKVGGQRVVDAAINQLPKSMGGPGIDSGITTYKFCI